MACGCGDTRRIFDNAVCQLMKRKGFLVLLMPFSEVLQEGHARSCTLIETWNDSGWHCNGFNLVYVLTKSLDCIGWISCVKSEIEIICRSFSFWCQNLTVDRMLNILVLGDEETRLSFADLVDLIFILAL